MDQASPASYLERYLDPFRDLLRRDDVVEIAINPDGKVWLEVAGDATMRHEGQTVDRTTAVTPRPASLKRTRSFPAR